MKRVYIDISGVEITIADGNFGYYSELIKVDIPVTSKIISIIPYGSFSAGIMACVAGNNSFRLSCHNKVILPSTNRYAYVYYI